MQSRRGVIGAFFMYDDGWVAPVLSTTQGKRNWFITTPLGIVNSNSKTVNHDTKPQPRDHQKFISKVTHNRIAFLNGWLFQGLSIDESARKYLKSDLFYASGKLRDDIKRDPRRPGEDRATFQRDLVVIRTTYLIISWPWFDTLLSENRIMADRYNKLIGSFEAEGLTYQFLAKFVKTQLTGVGVDANGQPIAVSVSEKMRIAAFNKFSDMLIAVELKQSQSNQRELPPNLVTEEATFTQVPPELPTNLIEESPNGTEVNNSPEGTPTAEQILEAVCEATSAGRDETDGEETVLVIPSVEQRV